MKRLLLFLLLTAPLEAAVNDDCLPIHPPTCRLTPGRHVYATDEWYIRLHNQTGRELRIDSVQGISSALTAGTEWGVYHYPILPPGYWGSLTDELTGAPPGDVAATWAGVGEPLPLFNWGGHGLSAVADSWTILHANSGPGPWGQPTGPTTPEMLWVVTVSDATNGIEVLRFPPIDEFWQCNSQNTWTTWHAYENPGTATWKALGATLFIANGGSPARNKDVDYQCVYSWKAGPPVIGAWCAGPERKQGDVTFPAPLQVPAGAQLAGQALNKCPLGSGAWGWAAYVWVER